MTPPLNFPGQALTFNAELKSIDAGAATTTLTDQIPFYETFLTIRKNFINLYPRFYPKFLLNFIEVIFSLHLGTQSYPAHFFFNYF